MLATQYETTANGKRLRLARQGSGPPLILLHGYPENLQIWHELVPLLAGHFEVIAFDWPGMGYSQAWPGGATPAHMAKRLLALIDGWGLDKVSLLGMDMGGQPALVFAAEYPNRISHLAVMNSLVFGEADTSWEIRVLRRFGWNRLIIRHLPRLVYWRARHTFLPRSVGLDPDLVRDFWEAFRQVEVRRFVSKMCAGYQGRLEQLPESYARVACPTLVLWGDCDKHFPPIQAELLAQTIANSCLAWLVGGEHWMAAYRAGEVADQLIPFLSSEKGGTGTL